ncbi:MAG: HPP family protein [Deltaproteobacteria bacterium]|nr:HPP family protein [Deltaproteobacteria bacterium]
MSFELIDPRFKRNLRSYLFQSFLAFVSLLLLLWLEGAHLARTVIIAAIGSTGFVLFVSPHSSNAAPRRVIGGHLVGLLIGCGLALFDGTAFFQDLLHDVPFLFDVEAALAVGLSILLMAATDTEHAPAAGTALAMVAQGFSWQLVIFVVSSVVVLVLIHRLLRPYLKDLL